jgi:hypothetical protein
VNSVWEQEKPEARKILKNAAESHPSAAPNQDGGPSFFPKETIKRHRHIKYTPYWQVWRTGLQEG